MTASSPTVVEIFTEIYRGSAWQGDVPSGPGSTLKATALLRPQLRSLFAELAIASLCDAPCGDGTWIGGVTGGLLRYAGFDVVPDLIDQNLRAGFDARHSFAVADIISDVLPRADAILCRDCLVHFPLAAALQAIANFRASGSAWLIATTFIDWPGNIDIEMGGWRPLNLTRPPFDFPAPLRILRERPPDPGDRYNDKALGVWKLADVPSNSTRRA